MPVTANTTFRKVVVAPLARPFVEKRRCLNRDARPSTECISKKAAPPVSTIASDKLTEAEAILQARDGDQAAFEYLYRADAPTQKVSTNRLDPGDSRSRR
jgi:hypothetical protein